MLALAAPTDAQNPPMGHGEHEAEPGEALKLPTPHGVHADAPTDGPWLPRVQEKHMTEPLNELNVPVPHSTHVVPSPFVCAEPVGHLVHAPAPSGLSKPGGQKLHCVGSMLPISCSRHSKAWSELVARRAYAGTLMQASEEPKRAKRAQCS